MKEPPTIFDFINAYRRGPEEVKKLWTTPAPVKAPPKATRQEKLL